MSERRLLIGWYEPGTHRFCYLDEKEDYQRRKNTHYNGYTVPVYAITESECCVRATEELRKENEQLKTTGTELEKFCEVTTKQFPAVAIIVAKKLGIQFKKKET